MIKKFILLETYYRTLFLEGCRALILLFKEISHLCADNICAGTQRNSFNAIVPPQVKKFSTASKRKYECRKSLIVSDYAVLVLIVMQYDNLQ